MVNYCNVVGCTNRSDRERDRHYYRLPKVITNQGKACQELCETRRRLWLAALGQDFSKKNLSNIRICSDHFIDKKKANLYDKDDPNWVPSVNLRANCTAKVIDGRYRRRCNREKRRMEAAQSKESEVPVVVQSESDESETSVSIATQTDLDGTLLSSIQKELQELTNQVASLNNEIQHKKFDKSEFENNDDKLNYIN